MKTDFSLLACLHWGMLIIAVLFTTTLTLEAQCLDLELILINSCVEHPNPNGGPLEVESELVVVSSGLLPVSVNSINLDIPNNAFGFENSDINQQNAFDCNFKEPSITSLPGCPSAIPLGPNDEIPANSFVVIFTTGTTVTADIAGTDFSNLCPLGRPIYILQNECERTSGAFVNTNMGGNPIRSVSISSPCGPRISTYNTSQISPEDGTYYLVGSNMSGNLNCDLPEIPETCPSIDTVFFICDPSSSLDPVPATDLADVYNQNEVAVSFHTSPATAEQNTDQITVYTPTGVARDTIWARIIYAENLCVVVSPLVIIYQNTIATTTQPAGPALGCDVDGSGLGLFNLRQLDGEIGGGQPITYYTDAGATNMITEPTDFESIPITIFARAGLGACEAGIVPVELEIVDSPSLNPFVVPTSCAGNLDGSIILNASSMNGPLAYNWAGDSLPDRDTLLGLAPGNYSVTVTNAVGCETTQSFSIVDGLPPQMICSLEQAVSAPGATNGVVRLEIAEGRRPYQVTYSGAAAGGRIVSGAVGLINGLGVGVYDFVVTDADGCVSDTCTVEVAEVIPITLTCSVRNNSDGGVVLGSALTLIEGGVPPFLVQLTDDAMVTTDFPNQPNGEIIFRDLAIGDYAVTVTGADGAVARCIFSIVQVACPLTIASVRQFPVDCSGSDNIIVSITGSGNNGDISTVWSGPNNVELFNGMQDAGPLPPGEYFIAISDESGCPPINAGPFIVVNPGQPEYVATTTGISSACSDNGSIEVEYTRGGNPPFIVHLVDARNDMEIATASIQDTGRVVAFFDLPGAATGPNYYVYLTDVIGCFADTTFLSIIGEAAPNLNLDAANQVLTPPGCLGDSTGAIQLLAMGGSGNYSYRWLDYPQRATGRILPDGDGQVDLPAGTYTIEVGDVGGCLDTFQLALADGLQPTLSCSNPTGGTGNMLGSVMVDLNNGTANYTLNLNSPALDTTITGLAGGLRLVSNLPAGNYVGTLTDANNCTTTTCSFTIDSAPCTLTATATIDSVDCTGVGQISVAVAGNMDPTTFTWAEPSFPDAATVMPNTPGRYDVQIRDQNGCSLDTFFTVFSRDNFPSFSRTPPANDRLCIGDEFLIPVTFTGQAPFDLIYELEGLGGGGTLPGFQQFNNQEDTLRLRRADFPADSILIRFQLVADGNCANDFSDQLTSLFFERPDTIRRFDVSCETDPIDIGGRSFSPMNPSDTFLVDDGSICGLRYEVALTFQTSNATPDTVEVFLCPGTDFIVAETQDTFNAARPEGPVAYPRPGECDSIVYLRMDIPVQNFGAFSQNACAGDTIFYGDRFFTADNTSGLARLPGEAADGCDSLVFVTTSFRRTGELRLFGDFNICPGDSIDLRFTYDGPGGIDAIIEDTQGNTYDFPNVRDNDRIRLFPTESTAYQITSTIAGMCPGTFAGGSTVTVNDLDLMTEVLVDPTDFCIDTLGKLVATPIGGVAPYTFAWSNGPTDSLNRNLLEGMYAVTVVDADGCVRIDSLPIESQVGIIADLTAVAPSCEGGFGALELDTIFGGAGFYEISLDGTFFLPVERIGDFNPLPGLGTATIQDVDDCSITINYFIPPAEDPTIDLLEDTLIFLGDSVLLDPIFSVDLDTAFWTPSDGLRTPDQLTTIAAPEASRDYLLTIRTADGCEFTHLVYVRVDERLPVYAPNVFSPNGDEVNDVFELQFGSAVADITSFQIFNRWGNLMHDNLEGWDGNYNGQPAQIAVYVYQAIVRMADGSERFIKGDFVLMR